MSNRFQHWAVVGLVAAATAGGNTGPLGNREGNGGDHVRFTFLKMGRTVMTYLLQTREGQIIIRENNLDPARLNETLTIHRIEVVSDSLRDNGGSLVDATWARLTEKIRLKQQNWMDHFEKERDVYYLVFHEMLRAAGYNDDDYVISDAINPFPGQKRIATRITPAVPLVAGELLKDVVLVKDAFWEGDACPSKAEGTYLDFDTERNILDITPSRARLTANGITAIASAARKACNVSIPINVPLNKRLKVTQLDVLATAQIPYNGKGVLNVEVFRAGGRGQTLVKEVGETKGVPGRTLMRMADVFDSGCGGITNLRLKATEQVYSPNVQWSASLAIDRISFYVKMEDCDSPDVVADTTQDRIWQSSWKREAGQTRRP